MAARQEIRAIVGPIPRINRLLDTGEPKFVRVVRSKGEMKIANPVRVIPQPQRAPAV